MRHTLLTVLVTIVSAQLFARPTAPKIHSAVSEQQSAAWKEAVRFAPVRGRQNSCAIYTPPQAISRRAPLDVADGVSATLNFVVTQHGEVNDVVLLDFAGISDQAVAKAVAGWRFRPATCDGVPTDSEATLQLRSSF